MARILVCADGFFRAFSPFALEPYIEGFINTLVRNGNEVLPYIAKDFEIRKKLKKKLNSIRMRKEILSFNPDLVIAFNNALDSLFAKKLSCPILVVASDTPIYWRQKDFIKENSGRYSVAFFNNDMADQLRFEYKIPPKRQLLIPYSTDMHADKTIAPKYDISFIGNFYNPSNFLVDFLFYHRLNTLSAEDKKQLKDLTVSIIDELKRTHQKNSNTFKNYKKLISLLGRDKGYYDEFVSECFSLLTYGNRQKLLMALSDKDLHIWTWDANLKILGNNYELFKNCHLEACYSQSQNEAIYNASKISLNMPHAQVNTGFSWRVCDILSSNAMLLSNPSEDLTRLFGGAVPTYNSPEDLRKKALYYLKNDRERKEIVEICHKFIDKNHRYENVFKIIEDYYGLRLLNEGEGKLNLLRRTMKKQNRYLRSHSNG